MNTPAPKPAALPPWWWDKLTVFWAGHGTKLIGGIVAVFGLVAAADPTVVELLTKLFGSDRAAGIVVLAGGALTVYRGFQNSKQSQ